MAAAGGCTESAAGKNGPLAALFVQPTDSHMRHLTPASLEDGRQPFRRTVREPRR